MAARSHQRSALSGMLTPIRIVENAHPKWDFDKCPTLIPSASSNEIAIADYPGRQTTVAAGLPFTLD
ncbi:hypothetical protein CHELA20_11113 [Hyphomicrobiales bacterium]|nr:hypothetical protein CHELA20_11113 [Hyphomicrobiales bacterium]CAH1694933.1 hypothetical protein CHELA41_51344 [Hyphomicrobiales bacterium]